MIIIFGLGFTGTRLARRLLRSGLQVVAPVRSVERFHHLAASGLQLSKLNLEDPDAMRLPLRATMVVLIPPLPEPDNTALRAAILSLAPIRVVYVSSTGIYGAQSNVDAGTLPAPNDDRGTRRLDEERWMVSGPWTSFILRSGAIYGPGRGAHAALREGKPPRSSGSGIVSRIHVEDLAAIIEAGLFSDIQGAWPVADDEPCSSQEITRWWMESQGAKLTELEAKSPQSTQGRRVDGTKIREILAVQLMYASWREGVPASLLEEELKRKN